MSTDFTLSFTISQPARLVGHTAHYENRGGFYFYYLYWNQAEGAVY